MGSAWMDELWAGDDHLDDEGTDDFYCPYTNGTECPIITKGWQPQDLCDALGRNCMVTYRDRHGDQHTSSMHVCDVTFVPIRANSGL
ncbi:unnamed protein product, partial [marine sediment metagenome]